QTSQTSQPAAYAVNALESRFSSRKVSALLACTLWMVSAPVDVDQFLEEGLAVGKPHAHRVILTGKDPPRPSHPGGADKPAHTQLPPVRQASRYVGLFDVFPEALAR
ncbi:hypothetical protein H0H92_010080, partial [Tricholoma furcatifolium]